jgi:hypothetical protein
MRSAVLLLLILAAALAAVVGCSDDSTSPTAQSSNGLIEGEIGDADFEFIVDATGNAEGPFSLRGTNLHYVDSLQALVVDLTVTNDGQDVQPEPVLLTFVKLLPDGVAVLNPDNGINDESAAIQFAFADGNGQWSPGESSLPHTVQFGVGSGTSVGFAARLDIGKVLNGGTISGRVWNDANEDGVMDPDEDGVEGVTITLNSADDDSLVTAEETATDEDGNYAFEGLRSGIYNVAKVAEDSLMTPTTPTEITVLLVEVDGQVSDFTEANFGCLVVGDDDDDDGDDDDLDGAFVEVNGSYRADPDRVEAHGIEVGECDEDMAMLHNDWDDDDDDEDEGEDCSRGKLRGPVTDIDADGQQFAVMGTWINAEGNFPDWIDEGDRVDARVRVSDDGEITLERLKVWHNPNWEQVHGRADEVTTENGMTELRVLNTVVIVRRHDT